MTFQYYSLYTQVVPYNTYAQLNFVLGKPVYLKLSVFITCLITFCHCPSVLQPLLKSACDVNIFKIASHAAINVLLYFVRTNSRREVLRFHENIQIGKICTYLPIVALKLLFTFEHNVSFIFLQKNVMSEKTLANKILLRVRHFGSKNWTSLVTSLFCQRVLHHGTFSVTKANMASVNESIFFNCHLDTNHLRL